MGYEVTPPPAAPESAELAICGAGEETAAGGLFSLPDEARAVVWGWQECARFVEAQVAGGSSKARAYAAAAGRRWAFGQRSAAHIKRYMEAAGRQESAGNPGWYAFIPHHICGGCGTGGCGARKAALPRRLVDAWQRRAESNDKRAMAHAHRALVRDLAGGKLIPGLRGEHGEEDGTWRDIWRREQPGRRIPSECPYGLGNLPRGWSLSNFYEHRDGDAALAMARKGLAAGTDLIFDVMRDTTRLRPMELVVFDDVRLDFLVWHGAEVCELWGLFAMDVATRKILAYGLRPAVRREDGSKEGLVRRDMQHLIAGILRTYGHPTAYQCRLLVENAAAAVTPEVETAILQATCGMVTVDRTGMTRGNVFADGWRENSGQPKDKAWIESYFNSLHIGLGGAPGQQGSSYAVKPASLEDRKRYAVALLRKGEALAPAERRGLAIPFMSVAEAILAVDDVVTDLDARTGHEIEGFLEVREFRWAAGDAHWKRVDEPEFLALPAVAQSAIFQSGGRIRKEAPAEKWARIYRPGDFARVEGGVYAALLMDMISATYSGAGHVLSARWQGEALAFHAAGLPLVRGEDYLVRFDADRPGAGGFVTDGRGRYIGRAMRRGGYDIREVEEFEAQIKAKRKETHEVLRKVKVRGYDREAAQAALAAEERNARLFLNSEGVGDSPVEADTVGAGRMVADMEAEGRAAPRGTSATLYLGEVSRRANTGMDPAPAAGAADADEGFGY